MNKLNEIRMFPVGKVSNKDGEFKIIVDKKFAKALKGLKDFGYAQILWWFSESDDEKTRSTLVEQKPYKNGPSELGVFALRSPERPNPIAVSNSYITYVDEENGVVGLAYIDCFDGTPVLDIKPYTPSVDRIENLIVPNWCSHWPKCYEESGNFDWENEFNF